jgi:membrane-bound serine protease (ClpP class)
VAIVSALGSASAPAQAGADSAQGEVRIIEVSGLLDAVTTDFLLSELDRAQAQGALAVVLQVDSLASVVDENRYLELATRLNETPVTTAMWVGPSGSAAEGGTAELAGVVDIVGVAGGSRIGATGPARLPDRFGPAFGEATARLVDQAIGSQEAIDLGISVGPIVEVSTLPTFLLEIDGYELVINENGEQVSNVTQDFLKLPITSQLFHTVASPEITYLFLTGGLALLIFELYTAGVGIAGLVGLGMVLAGTYGLATLPFRPLGVVLLFLSFVALAIDIQTNLPRAYTVVGLALFVAGTFLLWDGITMSWVTGMVGIVGAFLYAYIGMPTMVRTRFSSPVIGRKWLLGSDGQALTELSPEAVGEVRLGEARWSARSATGIIAPGQHITVTATQGVELVVEPSSPES